MTKLNQTGTALVYSGFIGGSGTEYVGAGINNGNVEPAGIAVDATGAAYVIGYTDSTNIATVVGPDLTWNGGTYDAFVAKIKADGSGFDYLGYIGGTFSEYGYAIAVDSSGNAYVGGTTDSFEYALDQFPTTVGPDLTHDVMGGLDGFICRLKATQTVQADPRNNYDYCGYVGGSGYDYVTAVAVVQSGASQGVTVFGGYTDSPEATFPEKVGPDLTQNNAGADWDGFVAKLNAVPSNATPENNYVYCGYVGGSGDDRVMGVAIDASENVYVAGLTSSTAASFPVVGGPDLTYNLGAYDAFVARLKLTPSSATVVNNYVYSGYIGGSGDDRANGIAVTALGVVYVGGVTTSTQAQGFPVTVGPDLTYNGGADDGFVAAVTGGPSILYRSVGNNGGASLASGGGSNALTIAGSTATFGAALANNIGVGDVIQYNSNGALAFVHGRSSSQAFTVKDKAGNPPAPVAGDTGWLVYRAYRSLADWESQTENASIVLALRDFDTAAGLDLVATNTIVNVACYADANDTTPVQIAGWTTDPGHYISIFTPYLSGHVGASQRHAGTWASGGYALVAALNFTGVLDIRADYVRVTGLRIDNTQAENAGGTNQVLGILSRPTDNALFEIQVSHNIVRTTGSVALNAHDWRDSGLYQYSSGGVLKAWNNIIYGFGSGIASEYINFGGTYALYNNTIPNYSDVGIYFQGFAAGNYRWANNLVQGLGGQGNYRTADLQPPGLDYSASNLSQDNTSPNAAFQLKTVTFVGAPDYHLSPGDFNAKDQGTNLSSDPVLAVFDDVDRQLRQAPWDIGADDTNGTTAVKLMSFSAAPGDRSVLLEWRTASELDNLGFHVYRGLSEGGPWTRLTTGLVPGLGSSAVGRAYSYRDSGLANGTRYFYRLEDVDASSKTASHGPVSAVPLALAAGGAPGSEPEASSPSGKRNAARSSSCPDWVVAAYGATTGASASSATPACTRHGDPEAVSLGVVSRDARQATLELKTGGFYALHTLSAAGEPAGRVRVFVPGFDFPQDPQAPALPFRRALVDAVVGRRSSSAACVRSIPWPSRASSRPRSARRRWKCRETGRCARVGGAPANPRRSTWLWVSRGSCRASSRGKRRAPSSRSRRCASTHGASRSCSQSGCW